MCLTHLWLLFTENETKGSVQLRKGEKAFNFNNFFLIWDILEC